MVKAATPTLAKIKNEASETDVRALLYIAICEVCDFFNVGKNMNDTQVAITIDLILESFWYLKLEEIKFCLRRAMRREKLYDRLDGNIILGWIEEYDAERTEAAICASEEDDKTTLNAQPAEDAISFDEWRDDLEARAKTDPEAAEVLAGLVDRDKLLPAVATNERHKHIEFKQRYWQEYAKKIIKP